MKKIALIFIGTVLTLMSCDTKKDNFVEKKSDQYYTDYLKSELLKNGIKNTEYYKIGTEEADFEGLNHAEIIANIEKAIPQIKQDYEMDKQLRLIKLNVFIATIRKHNLEEKEPFYKILLSDISDDEKLDVFYKEERIFFDALGKAKELKDVSLSQQLTEKYYYLDLIARDADNTIVNLEAIPLEQRTALTYSIAKYDVAYKKALELEKENFEKGNSVLYINDIKVE